MKLNQFVKLITGVLTALVLSISLSNLEVIAAQPQKGEKFADFELKDLGDKKHKLSELSQSNQVVLLVLRGYPGYQCPLCSKQAAQFLAKADEFKKAGAKVVMIYPAPANGIDKYAREFIEGKDFPENFVFLIDPDYQFLIDNDLRWDAEQETSYPSTFVLDSNRMVKFAKISMSHGGRTKPDEVLAELK
ncbi:MAG: redoxin domain-containing protein [Planctomycetaceae bacterium]|nr:redoxin domain-containing protein [Planctomycetaceae bacterium]